MASKQNHSPAVDLTVGTLHPLPPHLAATLNPFQKVLRSPLGVIIFVLIALFFGAPTVVGLPPIMYALEWAGVVSHWPVRRFFDTCIGNWLSVMTFCYESLFGIKIRTFGFGGNFKRRSLIIMNHVTHMDWMYLWDVVDKQGHLSYWKAVTKRLPVREIPIIGHCMQMSVFLFIYRKWEKDRIEFQNKLYYFNAIDYPVQLLMFPEGGDLTQKTKKRSDKYAEENNLPYYHYCFHPRSTGLNYIINALRDGGLDAVYDVTIGYPDILAKTEVDVSNGYMPKEVHFHIRSFDNADLPEDQEELKQWLRDRWQEKEDRLREFYTHQEFWEVDDTTSSNSCHQNNHAISNGTKNKSKKSPEVHKPKNVPFLIFSFVHVFFWDIFFLSLMWYVPYFWLYMLFGCFYLWYGSKKDLGSLQMQFKKKETEEAWRGSKRNPITENGTS